MPFSYRDYYESDAVRRAREQLEQNSQYNESESVAKARDALREHENNKVEPWTGGTYGQALQNQIDKIANRKEFTYDLNADALYQQYKDQYITGGKYAMMDTMGQAAALTGGYGNSYASTAGNQAYQAYLQKLNDVVPDLYRLALDKYNQEGQDMKDMYNIYANQYGTEYGEYRDRVGDWNTEAARLSDQYYNEANMDYSRFADNRDYLSDYYNNERNFDYGQYSDAYQRAFANYQQQVAEQQYWASYNQRAAASAGSGSGNGGSGNAVAKYSQRVNSFLSHGVLNPSRFERAGGQAEIGGTTRQFGSYDDYFATYADYALKKGLINENDYEWLLDFVASGRYLDDRNYQ